MTFTQQIGKFYLARAAEEISACEVFMSVKGIEYLHGTNESLVRASKYLREALRYGVDASEYSERCVALGEELLKRVKEWKESERKLNPNYDQTI